MAVFLQSWIPRMLIRCPFGFPWKPTKKRGLAQKKDEPPLDQPQVDPTEATAKISVAERSFGLGSWEGSGGINSFHRHYFGPAGGLAIGAR